MKLNSENIKHWLFGQLKALIFGLILGSPFYAFLIYVMVRFQ